MRTLGFGRYLNISLKSALRRSGDVRTLVRCDAAGKLRVSGRLGMHVYFGCVSCDALTTLGHFMVMSLFHHALTLDSCIMYHV